ncbi:hypothetical protein ACPYO6_16260 [Georgenia sp. Z1344]|uniref:hypothetical protein n=1 Tax=Georgenia sp. Z1344 TaxID=3416706 RepID=UPI003CEA87B3
MTSDGPKGEKPGDESELRPVTGWQWLWRAQLGTTLGGTTWDVDVDLFDLSEKVHLYRDGVQDRVQRGKSRFELPHGHRIEVAWSTYGLSRAHLVDAVGQEVQLEPRPGTGERWRADLERERPAASRLLAVVSWTILALALLLELPQLVQLVSGWTGWFDFTSPVSLPSWANVTLMVAGVVAALERALGMRNHWLLDE